MSRHSSLVTGPSFLEREGPLSLLRSGPLLALGLGHAAVDLCGTAMPIFYPALMAALGLSYASAGALATVQSTFGSLSQPFFGWLADRFGGRWVASLSLLAAAGGLALVGYAPGYHALLAAVALLGLGVGAYHPQAAKSSALLGGRWRTTGLSIYMVLGSFGFSSGPLLAAALASAGGLRATALLLAPAALVALLLFLALSGLDRDIARAGRGQQAGNAFPFPWKGAAALAAIIVTRSWVANGLMAFLPRLYAMRQAEPHVAGQMLFLLFFAEGLGTGLGGWLGDRLGQKPTLVLSLLPLPPLVHLFLGAQGPGAMALALPVGLLLGCSTTVTLVACQELLPTRMGMASGLALSLSQIMGGIGAALLGLLADRYGLAPSMEVLVAAAVVAGAVAVAMPISAPPPPVETPSAAGGAR